MLRLSALYRYPLKSGKGQPLQGIGLDKLGLDGDRRWMLVDEGTGRFLTQRAVAKMSQLSLVERSGRPDAQRAGPWRHRRAATTSGGGTAARGDHLA